MGRIFIESRMTGDYNFETYSKKEAKASTKNKHKENIYVIFADDKQAEVEKLVRWGRSSFCEKSGICFGARMDLYRLGTFIVEPV